MIEAVAAGQHGLVRAQLRAAGVAVHAIEYRMKKGRLRPLHRGVYRVGPLTSRYEREMAAVLACGEKAVLSHRSAAALWGLLPHAGEDAPVEVSVGGGCRVRGPGVRVHRPKELRAAELTALEGIPITTPARTVLDLAGSVSGRELEQALATSERRGLATRAQIAGLLAHNRRRPGTRILRALVTREGRPALTRSEAESRFLLLVRRGQLGEPEANVLVEGHEVDFLWRMSRLIVEIDGFAFHSSQGAFEDDRRRDAVLLAAGFRVVRVTWRQLSREPEALLVRLARALSRAKGG